MKYLPVGGGQSLWSVSPVTNHSLSGEFIVCPKQPTTRHIKGDNGVVQDVDDGGVGGRGLRRRESRGNGYTSSSSSFPFFSPPWRLCRPLIALSCGNSVWFKVIMSWFIIPS